MTKTTPFVSTTLNDNVFSLFLGITQKEAYEALGFNKNLVSRWRNNEQNPSIRELQIICEKCGVDWSYLYTGKSNNPDVIANAYFPILYEQSEKVFVKSEYKQARNFAKEMLFCPEFNYDVLNYYSYIVSICIYLAVNPNMKTCEDYYNKKPPHSAEDYANLTINRDVYSKTFSDENYSEYRALFKKMYYSYTDIGLRAIQKLREKAGILEETNYQLMQENFALESNFDNCEIDTEKDNELLRIQIEELLDRVIPEQDFLEIQQIREENIQLKSIIASYNNKSFNATPIVPDDFKKINFYPEAIAAGEPKFTNDYKQGVVIIHKDWAKNAHNLVATRIAHNATSMEPTIPAGSIITVDRTLALQGNIKALVGEIVVIYKRDEDGTTVKRLNEIDGDYCGVPDNRSHEHRVIKINLKSNDGTNTDCDRIIGKVNSIHYAL